MGLHIIEINPPKTNIKEEQSNTDRVEPKKTLTLTKRDRVINLKRS